MISIKNNAVNKNRQHKLYDIEALTMLQRTITEVYRKRNRTSAQSEALFNKLSTNLRLLETLHQLAQRVMAGEVEAAKLFRYRLLSLADRYPQINGSTIHLLRRVGATQPRYLSLAESPSAYHPSHHQQRPFAQNGLPCGGRIIVNSEMATIYTAVVAAHHFQHDSVTQPAEHQLTQMLDTVTALSQGHGHLENLGSSYRQGGAAGLEERIIWEESSGNPVFYTPDPVNGNPRPIIDHDYLPDTPCEMAREMCEGLLIDALNYSPTQSTIVPPPDLTNRITEIDFPNGTCEGDLMIIRGHDFGFTQPDDVSLILPVNNVCTIVPVAPSNWGDAAIHVTLPQGISCGLVGFYNTAKHAGYNHWVGQVNNSIKQINDVTHCLGTPLDIPQFGTITNNICPPDTGFNYIVAGKPVIDTFKVTGESGTGAEIRVLTGEKVTFFWEVKNSGATQIVVAHSNGEVEDTLPTSTTSFSQGIRLFSYTVKDYNQTTTLICTLRTKNDCGSSDATVKIIVHKPAQVFMTNMEVTQATQFLRADEHMTVATAVRPDNSVALIQRKPTLVRAYFSTDQDATFNNGTVAGVLVRLHGFRNGEELPDSPLSPLSEPLTANFDNSVDAQRSTLSRSANFRLPINWRNEEGNVTLKASLTLSSGSFDTVDETRQNFVLEGLRFYAASPLKCVLVRVNYTGEVNPAIGLSGVKGEPSEQDAISTLGNVRRMFPTHRVRVYFPNSNARVIEQNQPLTVDNDVGISGWDAVILQLMALSAAEVDHVDKVWCGVAHANIPVFQEPGGNFTAGVGSGLSTVALGYATFRAAFNGLSVVPLNLFTPAHEIGHAMDRPHHDDDLQWLTDGPGSSSQLDSIGEYGINVDNLFTVGTSPVFDPANFNDLMESPNSGTRWISPYTYKKLMQDFLAPTAPTNAAPSFAGMAETNVAKEQQYGEHLIVQGVLYPHDDKVSLKPLYHMPRYPNRHGSQAETNDYAILLVDAQDRTLYCTPLVDFRHKPIRREDQFGKRVVSEVPFFAALPFFPNTAALEIFRGRQQLARVERPANSPLVSKLTIEKDEKQWSLSWKAKHPDNLPLEYMVWVTLDDGKRWHRIGHELQKPVFRFDPNGLAGGAHCRLRVYASDGFNTTYTESETFKLPLKPPVVTPLNFEDGDTLPAHRPILLEAVAISHRDGSLEPEQITWHSNIQGELGKGEQIWVELEEGIHTISIRGREADNCIGECILSIHVS